jgi:TatD DNase family protein
VQLIDTHVHVNFDSFVPDLDAVADRWRSAGVVALVHSCVDPSEFERTRALADRFPELFFSVGLHPLDMKLWSPELPEQIQRLAQSDNRVVAIGETGLDFFKADDRTEQLQAFDAQLRIAQALDLPVIIHCRDAAAAMYEHCWGGTPEETAWFLELGFYISFSGTVTFKKAEQIHASAQMVPIDRILVETDCPFLSPVPKRGEKRNEPAYVQYVAQQVAQLRGMEAEVLARCATQNACDLFRLPISLV